MLSYDCSQAFICQLWNLDYIWTYLKPLLAIKIEILNNINFLQLVNVMSEFQKYASNWLGLYLKIHSVCFDKTYTMEEKACQLYRII